MYIEFVDLTLLSFNLGNLRYVQPT